MRETTRERDDEAMTVTEFVDRYYRQDRLRREPGTRERIIESRTQDLVDYGRALISRHESVTGEAVVLYDPRWRPEGYIRWCATY